MEPQITAIVFDLGGVLIDWDPRYLYRTLFDDEAAMEEFLATVTTQEWNRAQETRAGHSRRPSRSSPSAIQRSVT